MKPKLVASTCERLNEAFAKSGLKQADLVKMADIDKSSISLYLSGKVTPKGDKLYRLAIALNVDPVWLSGFDVPMEREYEPKFKPPIITEDTVTFPVIGNIAAGYNEIAIEDWSGETVEIPKSYLKGRSINEFFVLNVKGDSMYPMYHENDKVLILKQNSIDRSGDIAAVLYDSECATLKKVEFVKGEDWIKLVPVNPEYIPKTISGVDLEHCNILGIPKLLIREIN